MARIEAALYKVVFGRAQTLCINSRSEVRAASPSIDKGMYLFVGIVDTGISVTYIAA